MTDEQLGRAWAAKHGKRPAEGRRIGRFCWTTNEFGNTGAIADELASPGEDCGFWSRGYESESAAYADLGAALRRLQEHVRVD